MTLMQLLTPIDQVHWLSVTDTVRDALDHLETYELSAAPILDWSGRYIGTITEADLRRHVGSTSEPLARVERRARSSAVTVDQTPESIADQAAAHGFVPVVDATGRLVGIIDRRRIGDRRLPSAA